mmetsp:Transcript_17618/g.44609  ORF Transcript_17618/g.44609 Transcript_17618/m.44609 type:complete len:249 (-) Transcript_17618:474-1220(-)
MAQPSDEFDTLSVRSASGPTHSSGGCESRTAPANHRTARRQHSTEETTPQIEVLRRGDRRPRPPRIHSACRQRRAGARMRCPGKCGLNSCGVTSSPLAGSRPGRPSLLTWKTHTGGLRRPLPRASRDSLLPEHSSTSTRKTASSTLPTQREDSLATQSSARKEPTARTACAGTSGEGTITPGTPARRREHWTPTTVPRDRGSSDLATRSPKTQGRSTTRMELSLVSVLGHCSKLWPNQKTEQCPGSSS